MQAGFSATRQRLRSLVAATLALLASGCATPIFDQARALHHGGDSAAGLAVLESARDSIPDRDRLLLLLEQGTLALYSGDPDAAAQHFVAASDYIEEHDRISLRDETRALLTNEATTRYTGEANEKLLAHTYAMLGFLLAGKPESAAVEARRANKRLSEHDDALVGAQFTRALMALSFEMAGQFNDAYVAARALPAATLPATTKRLAARLGSTDPRPAVPEALENATGSARGELVLVVASGQAPRKYSSHLHNGIDWQIAFPAYRSRVSPPGKLRLQFDSGGTGAYDAVSEAATTDLDSLARRALEKRAGTLLLRQGLRLAAKHRLVDELQSKDDLGSQLLAFAIIASEVADTRGWYTLPSRLELRRVPIPPEATTLFATVNGTTQTVDLNQLSFRGGPALTLLRF